MSGGLGASLSDETINRGPVCYTKLFGARKRTHGNKRVVPGKILRKSHSDRETNTVAENKTKKGGTALVVTRSPRGEQPKFHAEKSRDLNWYDIK